MKRNQKTSISTVAVVVPTEQADATNTSMKVLNAEKIEEAVLVEPKQEEQPQPPKPSLSETMRIIDELHQKTKYRNKLEVYGDMLNQLVVKHREEDLTEKHHYSGCVLTITDDKNDDFELRNPVLIGDVIKYLETRFADKLAEIESEIVLP